MDTVSLQGGFADAPVDAANAFRAALDAMSRPGIVHQVSGASAPSPLSPAAAVLALTLCDPDTPIWLSPTLDIPAIQDWIRFHTGAPIGARDQAAFAFGSWCELVPLTDFQIGTPEYPDRSATLIVQCQTLDKAHRLSGPGIQQHAYLSVPDPDAMRLNAALFPLGVDFFFCSHDRLAAVPRTTQVQG